MSRTEVTIDAYRHFLLARHDESGVDWDDDDCPLRKGGSYALQGNPFGKDKRQPMVEVSRHGAQAFAEWLSQKTGTTIRLPTEAQWEYAARSGGRQETYAGGENVDRLAWHSGNSGERTHEVGTKAPNGLGLYDMSGNVWEWCADWYASDAYSRHSKNNPLLDSGGSGRVPRGGGWGSDPERCRSAYRSRGSPGYARGDLGFRLSRSK